MKKKKNAYENGKYVTVRAVQKVMYGVRVCVWGVCVGLVPRFPGLRLCSEFLDFLVSTSCLRNRSQHDHCGINPAEAQTRAGSWTRETACNRNSHSYSDFVVSFR